MEGREGGRDGWISETKGETMIVLGEGEREGGKIGRVE